MLKHDRGSRAAAVRPWTTDRQQHTPTSTSWLSWWCSLSSSRRPVIVPSASLEQYASTRRDDTVPLCLSLLSSNRVHEFRLLPCAILCARDFVPESLLLTSSCTALDGCSFRTSITFSIRDGKRRCVTPSGLTYLVAQYLKKRKKVRGTTTSINNQLQPHALVGVKLIRRRRSSILRSGEQGT